jgi:hypothetical protein
VDPTFGELVSGALRLDRSTFELAEHAPHGLTAALTVLLLAGGSETLGQAVILILNRVSRVRFVAALGLGGVELALEALAWIASVWLVAGLLVERPSFVSAVRVIGLAYAPLLFGILVFLPYVGPMLARLLRVWALLAAVVGVSVAFDITPIWAAVTAGIGFLLRWVFLRLFSGVFGAANGWLWRASTGRATPVRSSDVLLPLRPPKHGG